MAFVSVLKSVSQTINLFQKTIQEKKGKASLSFHVTIESKLFPKVPPVQYKEKRVKYNIIIIITRPSKMEVYHRDIRNINGYKWPHGMICTKRTTLHN